ncbi:MAG: CocE/NonD family hydrolase [Gammaproteobacteria bacterium]|nr:CocE/NonD family hydrolase [Gammaproteobacteria bacterium]
MRDGLRLETFVYLPESQPQGPKPAILLRTPYRFPEGGTAYHDRFAQVFTQRGYVFVLQNVRGRFGSEGVFEPFTNEVSDGADTTAWITTQQWSDGRIGTVGGSYNGFTALAAAVDSQSVKAVVADDPALDLFSGHRGGALGLLPAFWLYILEHGEWPDAELKQAASNAPDPAGIDNLLLGRDDPFWQSYLGWPEGMEAATLRGRIAKICVPVLVTKSRSEGWEDPADLWRTLRDKGCLRHRADHRLIVTARGHTDHLKQIGVSETAVTRRMIDWFDHWLRGETAFNESQILYRTSPKGRLLGAKNWPAPGRARVFYMHNPQGVSDNAPLRNAPSALARADVLKIDPRQMDPCSDYPRQTYLSEPLAEDLLVAGHIRLELYVRASTPSMELSGLVYDYDAARNKPLRFVNFGVVRVEEADAVDPQPVTIEMHSLSHRFPASSRIALALSGSPCGYVEAGHGLTRRQPPRSSIYEIFHGGAFPSRLVIENVLETPQ